MILITRLLSRGLPCQPWPYYTIIFHVYLIKHSYFIQIQLKTYTHAHTCTHTHTHRHTDTDTQTQTHRHTQTHTHTHTHTIHRHTSTHTCMHKMCYLSTFLFLHSIFVSFICKWFWILTITFGSDISYPICG